MVEQHTSFDNKIKLKANAIKESNIYCYNRGDKS